MVTTMKPTLQKINKLKECLNILTNANQFSYLEVTNNDITSSLRTQSLSRKKL